MKFAALTRRSPDRRAWRRAATQIWATLIAHGVKNVTSDEFDPYARKAETTEEAPRPTQDWKQMLAVVEAFNKRVGGKDLRKK